MSTHTFDSWAAFIAASRRGSSKEVREDAWFNGCTLAAAQKMADEGWLEGAEKARRFTNLLCDVIGAEIDRPIINYDVEGHNIDIARYLDNEPECWQKFEFERMQQPAVKYLRITINVSAMGDIDARTIIGRGSVIAALVELLEFAGNRVEVEMQRCANISDLSLTRAIIKRFDEPLDMPKVAYVLAHPSVLRVHLFALTGSGSPRSVPKEFHGDIHFDRMDDEPQWTNAARAEQWVRNELKRFGVTLHENTPTL